MHEMYLNDQVTIDITDSIEGIIEALSGDIDEIYRERLLNFAEYYLGVMEKELGIGDLSGSLEDRRNRVRAALLSRGAVNLQGAIQIGEALLGWADGEYYPLKFLYVPYAEKTSVTESDIEGYLTALREYLPAHILIGDLEYYQRTHGEIKTAKLTHGEMAAYTQEEIQYKVEI